VLPARLRLLRWTAEIVLRGGAAALRKPDVSTARALTSAGLDGAATERFLRPFLAGVLLERDLDTAARYTALVWRTFALGTVAVPARGMAELPRVMGAALHPGTVALQTPVDRVSATEVRTSGGALLRARAVVVATDPVTAARLLPELPEPQMRAVTTVYHVADVAPFDRPLLHLDGTGGPLLNTVVLTAAAPTYSPDHRALVSSSVLGAAGAVGEAVVREQAARLYGVNARAWQHLHTVTVAHALPALTAPTAPGLRRPVYLGGGRYVAGDHRDTPSLQGALVSGARTARAVQRQLSQA
jgi:hypothetical protein